MSEWTNEDRDDYILRGAVMPLKVVVVVVVIDII